MSSSMPFAAERGPLAVAVVLVREATVLLGVALVLAMSARIAVPLGFTPVPVTAQTFVVLLVGVLLGARRAGAGAATYLALGVAGVPWFAAGGATLGYLVGFVLAAWIVGRGAEVGRLAGRWSALSAMALAHAAIHLLGATWLALFLGVGAGEAFALGVAPFLVGDTVKVLAAAALAPTLVRRRG